jgi:thiamine biosynthesis lipoprotein
VKYLLIIYSCLAALHPALPEKKKFILTGQAQGTTYTITYYANDSLISSAQIHRILSAIDSSMSLYLPGSLINRFNKSRTGIRADRYLLAVASKSLQISQQTDGIFDITVLPLVKAWGFGPAGIKKSPDSIAVRAMLSCIGSDKIRIHQDSILKAKSCVQIDMNGIAQGYSVDLLAEFLESRGIRDYIVELGGEIRVKGRKYPSLTNMKIGIESPGNDEFERTIMQKIISLDSGAITTSGSYRKYHQSNGRMISHIIDPRTGYPSQNDLVSVTVYAQNAITADGYDNALMSMGLAKALAFVDKHPEISAYFIYRDSSNAIKDTASKAFYRLMVTE